LISICGWGYGFALFGQAFLKQSKYSATFLDWQLEKLFDFFSLDHESIFYLTEGLMNSTTALFTVPDVAGLLSVQ
jgi:hypothetical protein